jgi:hypothetical protein
MEAGTQWFGDINIQDTLYVIYARKRLTIFYHGIALVQQKNSISAKNVRTNKTDNLRRSSIRKETDKTFILETLPEFVLSINIYSLSNKSKN